MKKKTTKSIKMNTIDIPEDIQEEEEEQNLNSDHLIAKKNYKAHQFRIISISYGLFFGLIGIVLTTIEPFKACKHNFLSNQIKLK